MRATRVLPSCLDIPRFPVSRSLLHSPCCTIIISEIALTITITIIISHELCERLIGREAKGKNMVNIFWTRLSIHRSQYRSRRHPFTWMMDCQSRQACVVVMRFAIGNASEIMKIDIFKIVRDLLFSSRRRCCILSRSHPSNIY